MEIVFDSVTKTFGPISVLKDIGFTINPGEFVFLVGSSGAGKSTIIKLILHQIQPTGGSITIGGVDITRDRKAKIDDIRRQIGVIFQDYQLIPDKTVEENIALALDIISYPREKIPVRLDQVIRQVGLQNRRFLFPAQLSGGELQRSALARALAVEPKIILADEPTGNLDPENSWNLVKLLQEINLQNHTTILMTTHNAQIVAALDKKVFYLRDGQISNQSPAEEPVVELPHKIKKHHHSK